ncbi:hypothetical protein RIF29_45384 [Crotalaria pallida]|uniref:Uncharacterized protein n=1 Tax=Crotalaria pallida TaxID=3830 RepID=A0AAN9HL96_CROPI
MRRTKKFFLLPTFRSSHSFSLSADPASPNSFHSTNEESIRILKSRSANCSRIAPAPLEISRFRNISKPGVVKKRGMLYFQDCISYSNEPRNRKKTKQHFIISLMHSSFYFDFLNYLSNFQLQQK